MSTEGATDDSREITAGSHGDVRQDIGSVANGSSGGWKVAIDEALSIRSRWFVEIEGPRVYLYFKLNSLQVLAAAIQFLTQPPPIKPPPDPDPDPDSESEPVPKNEPLTLGKFAHSPVLLARDDEHPDRFSVVIGKETNPTIRIALDPEDPSELAQALTQIRAGLAEEGLL